MWGVVRSLQFAHVTSVVCVLQVLNIRQSFHVFIGEPGLMVWLGDLVWIDLLQTLVYQWVMCVLLAVCPGRRWDCG